MSHGQQYIQFNTNLSSEIDEISHFWYSGIDKKEAYQQLLFSGGKHNQFDVRNSYLQNIRSHLEMSGLLKDFRNRPIT